ncbi:hypothetical protein ACLOJK_020686 [Asimina triloba]
MNRLAGAALIAPVINYWWSGLPANVSKAAFKQQLYADKWAVTVAHYFPWLTHWWNTQKWFPGSSVIVHSLDLFSPPDRVLLPKFDARGHYVIILSGIPNICVSSADSILALIFIFYCAALKKIMKTLEITKSIVYDHQAWRNRIYAAEQHRLETADDDDDDDDCPPLQLNGWCASCATNLFIWSSHSPKFPFITCTDHMMEVSCALGIQSYGLQSHILHSTHFCPEHPLGLHTSAYSLVLGNFDFQVAQIRQQGEFYSLHRDMIVGFGRWDFAPMDLDNPFPHNEGSVHLWQGDTDWVVPAEPQRYIAGQLPWIRYHEVPGAGHMFLLAEDFAESIIKELLIAE